LELDAFGPPPLLPSNILILGIIIIAACLLFFYNGEYKRLQHEEMNTRLTDMETSSLLHQHDSSLYVPPSTITSLDDSANNPSHLVRIGSSDNSNDHRPTFVTTSLWTTDNSTSVDVRHSQTAPQSNAVQQSWQQTLVRAATQNEY
jgi:hypothetical protein